MGCNGILISDLTRAPARNGSGIEMVQGSARRCASCARYKGQVQGQAQKEKNKDRQRREGAEEDRDCG